MEQLKVKTEQLKKELNRLKQMYEQNNPPEDFKDKQFFLWMKADSTPVYDMLADWETTALNVVQQQDINLHPQQVVSTRENMELLLMHSYYKDARQKRYMELYQSIEYIFDQLLRSLKTGRTP
ncbi:DUF1798 family protein [Lentibacillus saliphilus]|uniref:DUF1798 family protein n=1 Tax=Lentibacillus saliphilus TaxID=2737028 RepID=UPI001C2FC78E|nr:DUF1798 family protein [Lentibacillus saliphilus]